MCEYKLKAITYYIACNIIHFLAVIFQNQEAKTMVFKKEKKERKKLRSCVSLSINVKDDGSILR